MDKKRKASARSMVRFHTLRDIKPSFNLISDNSNDEKNADDIDIDVKDDSPK